MAEESREAGSLPHAFHDDPELKPYYVYVLRDPRKEKNNEIFYVGKGQGERARQHARDALTESKSGKEDFSEKIKHLLEIQASEDGLLEQVPVVVARFDTEEEALAVESVLIKWVYGYDNLKNEIHGHGQAFIRKAGYYGEIPGIDIPERERRENSGAYTNDRIRMLAEAGAFHARDRFRDELYKKGLKIKDSSVGHFQTGGNGQLGFEVAFDEIVFRVVMTSSLRPKIEVIGTPNPEVIGRLGLRLAEMNKGAYYRIDAPVINRNEEDVSNFLLNVRRIICEERLK